jgi:hypothetical protein
MSKRRNRSQSGQASDPSALARQAMLDVLDRAKASRDDDRILAAAKSVLSAHGATADLDEAARKKKERGDLIIKSATREERNEMRDLISRVKAIKAQVARRISLEPEDDTPLRHEEPPREYVDVVYPVPAPEPAPTPVPDPVVEEEPVRVVATCTPDDDDEDEIVVYGPPVEIK